MNNNLTYSITVVPAFTIVGFRDVLGPKGAKDLWHQLYERMKEIDYIVNPKIGYGVVIDGSYIAGVQVEKVIGQLPDSMSTVTIPEKTYKVFTHRGPIRTLKGTWDLIAEDWRSSEVSFERYDERFNPDSEDSIIEIYVSI